MSIGYWEFSRNQSEKSAALCLELDHTLNHLHSTIFCIAQHTQLKSYHRASYMLSRSQVRLSQQIIPSGSNHWGKAETPRAPRPCSPLRLMKTSDVIWQGEWMKAWPNGAGADWASFLLGLLLQALIWNFVSSAGSPHFVDWVPFSGKVGLFFWERSSVGPSVSCWASCTEILKVSQP